MKLFDQARAKLRLLQDATDTERDYLRWIDSELAREQSEPLVRHCLKDRSDFSETVIPNRSRKRDLFEVTPQKAEVVNCETRLDLGGEISSNFFLLAVTGLRLVFFPQTGREACHHKASSLRCCLKKGTVINHDLWAKEIKSGVI